MRVSTLLRAASAVSLCCLLSAYVPSTRVSAWGQPTMENVLLKDVQSITLTRGKLTAGRRSQVPQLACTGGLCDPQYQPDTVLCRNVGSDGSRAGNVNWKCEAELANGLKFSKVDVICEGYSSPDDPRVTQGSCGLEYEIGGVPQAPQQPTYYPNQQPQHQQQYQQPQHASHNYQQQAKQKAQDYSQYAQQYYDHAHHKTKGLFGTLWSLGTSVFGSVLRGFSWLTLVVVAVIGFAIVRSCTKSVTGSSSRSHPSARPRPYAAHHDASAPPPYDGASSHNSGKTSSSYFERPNIRSAGVGAAPSSGLFGGWGGSLASAGLGYMLGNRNRSRTQTQQPQHQPPPPAQPQPQAYAYGNSYAAPPQQNVYPQPGYAPNAPVAKSDVHVATAYGGTKRR